MLDCSNAGDCVNGGYTSQALEWVIANRGQTSEASYPYTSAGPPFFAETCKRAEPVFTVDQYYRLPPGDTFQVLQVGLSIGC